MTEVDLVGAVPNDIGDEIVISVDYTVNVWVRDRRVDG